MYEQRNIELSKVADKIYELKDKVEELLSDEQEYYDLIANKISNHENVSSSQVAISLMEDALISLEEAISAIDAAAEQ